MRLQVLRSKDNGWGRKGRTETKEAGGRGNSGNGIEIAWNALNPAQSGTKVPKIGPTKESL
jgi:hypothetical protein